MDQRPTRGGSAAEPRWISRRSPQGEPPPCRWLGDLAYPLYITHFPFVLTYTAIVANAGWRSLAQAWPLALLTITLAIAFAWASARLYDAPLRRWLSRR